MWDGLWGKTSPDEGAPGSSAANPGSPHSPYSVASQEGSPLQYLDEAYSPVFAHQVSSSDNDDVVESQPPLPSILTQSQDKESGKAGKAAEREEKRAERQRAKEDRERVREEKRRQREEKQAERERKSQLRARRQRYHPRTCLQFLTIVVEESLYRKVLCVEAAASFPLQEVKFTSKALPIENSIVWTRLEEDGRQVEEEWAGVVWTAEAVAEAVATGSLISTFKTMLQHHSNVLLLVFAMQLYHKKADRRARTQGGSAADSAAPTQQTSFLSRNAVESGLVELQLVLGVCHRYIESSADLAQALAHVTRAISEVPVRQEKEEVEREMGWFSRGGAGRGKSVRINRCGLGLDHLWLQTLSCSWAQTTCGSGLSAAQAVAALYPTPSSLIQAYDNCNSENEKLQLLQNIEVKKGGGSRRLGPELSRKICRTFTSSDGSVSLSSK